LSLHHVHEVRPRKGKRGVDLISAALPFDSLWYTKPDDAIEYAKFRSRSHDAVIRVYDEAGNVIDTSTRASSKSRKDCLDLWGERIHYSMDGSSCALHNAVPDILGCLRSALRHVGCRVDGPRLNATNGDSDDDNDRKERLHGT
jgi:hypothetical protein